MKRSTRLGMTVLTLLGVLTMTGCLSDGIIGWSPTEIQAAAEHGLQVNPDDEAFTTAAEVSDYGLPRYRTDVFGIPYYAGNGADVCSWDDARIIRGEFQKRGATLEDQIRAVYTASRESDCKVWVHYRNARTHDDSYCAAQLNRRAGWFLPGQPLEGYDPPALLDSMSLCAEAFAVAWQACGWAPWTRGDYGCRPGSW